MVYFKVQAHLQRPVHVYTTAPVLLTYACMACSFGRKHTDMLLLLTALHSTRDSPNLISELFLKNLLLATGLICSVCLRHNVAAHNLASRLLLMIIDIIHPLTNLIFSCGSRCAVFKCVSVQRILAALPILINDSRIIFFVLEYALLASF